jgi:hypothetical protein
MPNQQDNTSLIERKAEALVLLRYFNFDFNKASDMLGIPADRLRNWAENFDEDWMEQIPAEMLEHSDHSISSIKKAMNKSRSNGMHLAGKKTGTEA